jgi:hypothetical protein
MSIASVLGCASPTNERPLALAQVTSPPYKHASAWIRQARRLKLRFLALLLKGDFHADERRKLCEEVGYPTRIWVLSKRPDFRNQGGPPMTCNWYVWDRWGAMEATLRYIPDGQVGLL